MDQKKQSLFLLRAYRTRYDMVWLPWFAAKEPAPWDSYGRIWDSRQRFIPSAGFPADMVSGSTWVAESKLWRSQHQWPSMTINDHQWPSMSINDHQWPLMTSMSWSFISFHSLLQVLFQAPRVVHSLSRHPVKSWDPTLWVPARMSHTIRKKTPQRSA